MTAKSAMTLEVALPPEQAEEAVFQASTNAGLAQVRGGGGMMHGTVSISMFSWGEDVQETIAYGPHGAQVQLRSVCSMLTVLFDFGKNSRNLTKISTALRALAPVARLVTRPSGPAGHTPQTCHPST